MYFTLHYFCNPNAVEIGLGDIGVAYGELPPGVAHYHDSSPEALAFLLDIGCLVGIGKVSMSCTAHNVSIFKSPRVTWADTMMRILRILRDRFAPGQAIMQGAIGEIRCFDRKLTRADFVHVPKPLHYQRSLFGF